MNLISEKSFSGSLNGIPVSLYTIRNRHGLVTRITNYGAIIVSIITPDREGKPADIVQGYDTLDEYMAGNGPYMGAVCGRCANRIAGGKFSLEGKTYSLPVNNGPNHLHGGIKGFDKVAWKVIQSSGSAVSMEYLSADGEEGYPGNLKATVTYTLTDDNELIINYKAVSDKTTIVNLTGHSYFNLSGEGAGPIDNHELMINSKFFTPTDETNIPTGEIISVKGTPMDFTSPRKIGKSVDDDFLQIKYGAGYDHNWVLNNAPGTAGLAARVYDPESGRIMEVYTTQPGLQLYTANWIDNEKGKGGKKYQRRWSFCLETQHFPDSVNKPHFPSVILRPGSEYNQYCIYKFLTDKS